MTKLADASINSFGIAPKAGFESSYVTVPAAFLEELIGATQSLKDEVAALREERDQDRQEMTALRASVASLETLQESEISRLAVDIAYDRQRLARLEKSQEEPTATESERIERIEKLCTDAPKHEISLSEIRGRLGIDKAVLSRLLKRIDGDRFYLRKSTLDKRIRYLCLRPEIGVR
jgi:chromosome segregation ATPase